MKSSMRAKRMQRHHSRMHKSSGLNLVSLMDIFTILVFFLMVNTGDVQVLQNNKNLKLPESVAEKQPKENLLLIVDDENVIVQGRPVITVKEVMAQQEVFIPKLGEELKYQASRQTERTEEQQKQGLPITIMGDKDIPYQLLKKIMTTCAKSEYANISLAVSKVAGPTKEQILQTQGTVEGQDSSVPAVPVSAANAPAAEG